MKFSIKDFFSKCDQIRRKLRISSHLLKKSLIENFIFCISALHSLHVSGSNMASYFHYKFYPVGEAIVQTKKCT